MGQINHTRKTTGISIIFYHYLCDVLPPSTRYQKTKPEVEAGNERRRGQKNNTEMTRTRRAREIERSSADSRWRSWRSQRPRGRQDTTSTKRKERSMFGCNSQTRFARRYSSMTSYSLIQQTIGVIQQIQWYIKYSDTRAKIQNSAIQCRCWFSPFG